jgi:hypothetical protein
MSKNRIDFIGIGAAKCVTTWVYRCLLDHPQICGSYIKEVNYFLTKKHPLYSEQEFENKKLLFKDGLKSYLNFFSHCQLDSIKGEISVSYMTDPGAARLIYDNFPDAKILVFLRDPVKRAFSYYNFARDFMLREKNPTFEEALENNPEIYIDWGMYYKHLRLYLDLFPKENIGIFFTDDIKDNQINFIQNVYRFLGVTDKFIPPSAQKHENVANRVKFIFLRKIIDFSVGLLYRLRLGFSVDILKKIGLQRAVYYFNYKINVEKTEKPEIKKGTEERLRSLFKEDIEKLEKLTGRNLFSWK